MNHISVIILILASCFAAILIYRTILIKGKSKTLVYFLISMLILSTSLFFDFFYHYFIVNIDVEHSVQNVALLIDRVSGGVLTASITVTFIYFIYSLHKLKLQKAFIITVILFFLIIIAGYFSLYFDAQYIFGYDTATVLNYLINEGSRLFLVIVSVSILINSKKLKNRKAISTQNRITLFYLILFASLVINDFMHFFINYNHQAFYLSSSLFYLFIFGVSAAFVVKYSDRLNLSNNKIEVSLCPINNQLINDYDLTPREREIIDLIVKGKTNKEISNLLYISYQTVKDHNYRIFKKLNVNSRVMLIQSLLQTQISA